MTLAYIRWYNSLSKQELYDIWVEIESRDLSWINELPVCPPCLPGIPGKFHSPDSEIWDEPHTPYKASIYHPGAVWEIRTLKATSKGAGNQCTYDANGVLIRTKYGHGTSDRAQVTFNIILLATNYYTSEGHIGNDVEPFDLAYSLDGNRYGRNVDLYIRVRPLR